MTWSLLRTSLQAIRGKHWAQFWMCWRPWTIESTAAALKSRKQADQPKLRRLRFAAVEARCWLTETWLQAAPLPLRCRRKDTSGDRASWLSQWRQQQHDFRGLTNEVLLGQCAAEENAKRDRSLTQSLSGRTEPQHNYGLSWVHRFHPSASWISLHESFIWHIDIKIK